MMDFPPVERYVAISTESLEFQRGMLSLAATTTDSLQDITVAFKKWCASTPFPWRFALDYCLRRAMEGKSLPFIIESE